MHLAKDIAVSALKKLLKKSRRLEKRLEKRLEVQWRLRRFRPLKNVLISTELQDVFQDG